MTRPDRWVVAAAAVGLGAVIALWLSLRAPADGDQPPNRDAVIADVLSPESTEQVKAACSACHVFPEPDILPRAYWPVAVEGMYQIAADRRIELPVTRERAGLWYLLQAPDALPPAPGRTDAGPGAVSWERSDWRPADLAAAADPRPAVTHLRAADLFGGAGLDLLVSDASTDRVYALRPYDPAASELVLGAIPDPGRLAVTDLDRDGAVDVVVAALGQLDPTNESVGSIVWLRRTGPEAFEPVVLADGLGRVADVQAADLRANGRTDLLVASFGWMENGGLLWLESTGPAGDRPSFTRHELDARPGFTDVRAADLDGDGRTDVAALVAQEFQEVMVYWATDDGFRPETVFRAPNPDWGFTGLEVVDFDGSGLPDLIVTNGDNLDLTIAKPYHGVGLLENEGGRRFVYRHLTHMYGAHRAVPIDLAGAGTGLLVGAYLPPTVSARAPEPAEAVLWLERAGPTRLVRRVLDGDGVHHMTLAGGDFTGDGRPDFAVGSMDLGVVDPAQAHTGAPLTAFVTLWRNGGAASEARTSAGSDVIDWRRVVP